MQHLESRSQDRAGRWATEDEYHKKYYEYLADKADVHLATFRWQRRASEFLLWLVVAVVTSGLLFSGFQLWKASSLKGLDTDSALEVSVQRVKITSSVVGVVVLSISIVFLYLFLIEVYRIRVVDMGPVEVKPMDATPPIGAAPRQGGLDTDDQHLAEYYSRPEPRDDARGPR